MIRQLNKALTLNYQWYHPFAFQSFSGKKRDNLSVRFWFFSWYTFYLSLLIGLADSLCQNC